MAKTGNGGSFIRHLEVVLYPRQTKLENGSNLIQSLRLLYIGQERSLYKGSGDSGHETTLYLKCTNGMEEEDKIFDIAVTKPPTSKRRTVLNGSKPPLVPPLQAESSTESSTRGGARTTWNGPTSAQCRDHARCARHTTQRGADTARARAHTHEKDTRGPPEGQPDRARGTHRPHGMAYQRARIRDTRTGRPATRNAGYAGREEGRRGHTTPGTGPNPPEPAASAAHTQTGHCTRQGSSGAQRHAPTPRLGSHRASPRGSHWRQASSMGPAAPVPRATTL